MVIESRLLHFFLGGETFEEGEEYLQFRFRLLYILMLNGLFFNTTFLLADAWDQMRLGELHLTMTRFYSLVTLILLIAIYGGKERFPVVAWTYAVLGYVQFVSALFFVPGDEMRVVWFFLQISGVYIMLGQWPGFFTTVASIAAIHIANHYLSVPFSQHAVATLTLGLGASGVMFHAYCSRSVSFHRGMVASNIRLRQLSSQDPLTGLMNARAYYALADRMIALATRKGEPFAVLFIDLDHFKSINDRFGHEAGDAVLKEAAACLADAIRQSDALGRIGGEEFSMFLPNITREEAMRLAEKVRRDLEERMPDIGTTRLKITASIGMAMNHPGHRTFAEIQGQADQAMYRAKAAGRNRVTCFEELEQGQSEQK
ncbi:MAG: GGDEF domain-containing protein [Nitrospirae bacterium]|nr:GGDEF domain-containing protein [Magnetococcales bacterium]